MEQGFRRGVVHPGESYDIQNHYEMEGIFSLKITPLGANLCLVEELDKGFIQEMLCDGCSWWKRWFKSLRPWTKGDVDKERVMWVSIHGVPCNIWSVDFFCLHC